MPLCAAETLALRSNRVQNSSHLHAVLDGVVPSIARLVGVVDEVAIAVHQVLQRVVRSMQGVEPAVHGLQHCLTGLGASCCVAGPGGHQPGVEGEGCPPGWSSRHPGRVSTPCHPAAAEADTVH